MTMTSQIMLGTLFLSISALFHVMVVAFSIPLVERLAIAMQARPQVLRNSLIICAGLLSIVFALTVQIWFWASVYYRVGAFDAFEASFYFATVTYTTLGYGDLVLGPALRVFATFGAITGLLTFGISTAFLIGIISRLMPLQRD